MQQCSPSRAQNKKQEAQNKDVMHSYVDVYTITIIRHIKHNMKIFGLVHHVKTKIMTHLQREQEFKSNIFTQKCKN